MTPGHMKGPLVMKRMSTRRKYPQYPKDTLVTHKTTLPQGKLKRQRIIVNPKTYIPEVFDVVEKQPGVPNAKTTIGKPYTLRHLMAGRNRIPGAPQKVGTVTTLMLNDQWDLIHTTPANFQLALQNVKNRTKGLISSPLTQMGAFVGGKIQPFGSTVGTMFAQNQALGIRGKQMAIVQQAPSLGQYVGAIAAAAALAAAQLTWRMGWVAGRERGFGAHGRDVPMKSSVVHYLDYDQTSHTVYVQLTWHRYKYHNVPPSVFSRWWQGLATCITTDRRRKKRWILGKTPSLGAFYNAHIKGRYAVEKI